MMDELERAAIIVTVGLLLLILMICHYVDKSEEREKAQPKYFIQIKNETYELKKIN